MQVKTILLAIILLSLPLGIVAEGDHDDGHDHENAIQHHCTEADTEVTIKANGQTSYDKNELVVPTDSCVKVIFINEVDIPHDFIIDEVTGENGMGFVHMYLLNSTDVYEVPYTHDDHHDDGDVHTDDDHHDDGHTDDHNDTHTDDHSDEHTNSTNLELAHGDETHEDITPGQTFFMMQTPAEPAEFEYYCSIPGHKEGGMYGTLKVQNDGLLSSLPGPSLFISLAALLLVSVMMIRRRFN